MQPSLPDPERRSTPRRGPAFSNGTEHEMWSANWCDRCLVDAPFRNDLSTQGCPIILKAFLGEIPDEWIEQPADRYPSDAYHCIEFKPPGWRNPEPQPKPTPPGQLGLFARGDVEGVRVLTSEPQRTPAEVHRGA